MTANHMRNASLTLAQHCAMANPAWRAAVDALPASNILHGWKRGPTDGQRSNHWCEGSLATETEIMIYRVIPDTIPDGTVLLHQVFFHLSGDLRFIGWTQLSSDPADQNYDPVFELDDPELTAAAFQIAIRTIKLG